jgi:hypothetical protein
VSSDFTNQCLFQIQAAARSPFGGISELAINAALAMIEAAAPKDEIEGALAVQMACTHMAAMAVLARLDSRFADARRISAFWVGCGSINEGVCDASRGSSTVA